jgi:hypothetical protein
MTTRAFGRVPFRSWIDGAWLLLSLLAIVQSVLRLARPLHLPRLPVASLIAFPIVLFLAYVTVVGKDFVGATYAMELKPIFYIAVAWLWVLVYGFPSKRAYVQAGLYLSALIAAELVVSSILQRTLVRPTGSGEVNYDACLIILSLCVALTDESNSMLHSYLLFAGIMFTFSRTAVTTALIILLLSRRVPKSAKLIALSASVASALLSFLVRGLEIDVGQIDRYLMWTSAIQLFFTNPSGLVWGYGVGSQLPVSIPAGLEDLWHSQSQGINLSGVYAFQYHAMWLRMIISWGIFVVVTFLITMIAWILQNRDLLRRYLALTIVLEGFSMGVVYISNVGVPLFILLLLACRDI